MMSPVDARPCYLPSLPTSVTNRVAKDPHVTAGQLRLDFIQLADRFAQRLCCLQGETSHALIESLESSADEHWPTSPPLQQLHFEQQAGNPIAMLVGMAGTSHWSAAVTVEDNGLNFDVACRTAAQPGWLGSTFQVGEDARLSVTEAGQVVEVSRSDARILITAIGETELQIKDAVIQLTPSLNASSQTQRWRYRIAGE